MFCTRCGKEAKNNAKFCLFCGNAFSKEERQAAKMGGPVTPPTPAQGSPQQQYQQQPQQEYAYPQYAPPPPRYRKPWYRRAWVWLVCIISLLAIWLAVNLMSYTGSHPDASAAIPGNMTQHQEKMEDDTSARAEELRYYLDRLTVGKDTSKMTDEEIDALLEQATYDMFVSTSSEADYKKMLSGEWIDRRVYATGTIMHLDHDSSKPDGGTDSMLLEVGEQSYVVIADVGKLSALNINDEITVYGIVYEKMASEDTAHEWPVIFSMFIESLPGQSIDEGSAYSQEEAFVFDQLEIVFGSNIEWDVVNNKYSDNDGSFVFKVPVTVTNLSAETHGLNMFSYSRYGSQGTKLDSIAAYFDNTIEHAGDMRPGASQTAFMCFLYDGDGDYFVEFNGRGDKIEVRLPITKTE